MNTLRDKALKETGDYAEKERFALFSQPPPLGMGDCFYDEGHHPKDEETGMPVTKPRNLQTNPMHLGQGPDVYFDNSNFLNKEKVVEPYKDYPKIHKGLKTQLKPFEKDAEGNPIKPTPFVPAVTKWNEYEGEKGIRLGNPYASKADNPHQQTKCYKSDEGGVTIGLLNVKAHPIRDGHYNSTYGHTINPYPKYMPDNYDIGRHQEYLKEQKWVNFYKESGKGTFNSMSAGPFTINEDKKIYGERPPLDKRNRDGIKYKGIAHTDPFIPNNPNKRGKLGTIGPFERLIPDPTAIHKAKRKPVVENKIDPFKPSRGVLTRPTPSISLNFMNIRSAIRG